MLRAGARFGVFDVMRTGDGELAYPLPWASTADTNAIAPAGTVPRRALRRGVRDCVGARAPRCRARLLRATASAGGRRAGTARRPHADGRTAARIGPQHERKHRGRPDRAGRDHCPKDVKSAPGQTLHGRCTPRTARCPLRSDSDRVAASPRNVARGHNRTRAPQHSAPVLSHLIGVAPHRSSTLPHAPRRRREPRPAGRHGVWPNHDLSLHAALSGSLRPLQETMLTGDLIRILIIRCLTVSTCASLALDGLISRRCCHRTVCPRI